MSETILIVDDEKEIADLVELYLRNENYHIEKAVDSETALDILEKKKIGLALLDVMLPDMDGFTLLRVIKEFGGGDLMTGIIYMALIFIAAVLLVAFGCAFHSGDRHAFVRNNPKLVRGHHGKIVLCWICSLLTILPMIIAIAVVIVRYLPVLKDLNGVVMNTVSLPSTKVTLMILAVGAVLTIPFLPLRSLIPAAYVNGLEKE